MQGTRSLLTSTYPEPSPESGLSSMTPRFLVWESNWMVMTNKNRKCALGTERVRKKPWIWDSYGNIKKNGVFHRVECRQESKYETATEWRSSLWWSSSEEIVGYHGKNNFRGVMKRNPAPHCPPRFRHNLNVLPRCTFLHSAYHLLAHYMPFFLFCSLPVPQRSPAELWMAMWASSSLPGNKPAGTRGYSFPQLEGLHVNSSL